MVYIYVCICICIYIHIYKYILFFAFWSDLQKWFSTVCPGSSFDSITPVAQTSCLL